MKKILLALLSLLFIMGCTTTENAVETDSDTSEEVPVTVPVSELMGSNLIETAAAWRPEADSYGSSFVVDPAIVVDGEINVDFTIAQKVGEEWPYIELICETGAENLGGVETITITYKCGKYLKVKLSQSDFGSEGDNSYAHYYFELPASSEWTTETMRIEEFYQPGWAPASSTEIPLILENIQNIYLVPDLNYNIGDSTVLSVKSMILQ